MPDIPLPKSLRARCARMARWQLALLCTLLFFLLTERFGAVVVAVLQQPTSATTLNLLCGRLVLAVPDLCYLLALWWVRVALLEFASGAFHTPVIATALRRVGIALALGSVFILFIAPGLQRLLGANPGYFIAYNIGSAVLCALGAALAMLAQVLKRAARVQTELDGMF